MRFGLRELIFAVVLIAVPVASLFYVFQPTNDKINAALSEIQTKRGELAELNTVTAEIEDLDRAIAEGEQLIQVIEEKLPPKEAVDLILDQIWQITATNGLNVKSVKSEKEITHERYRELPLAIIVEGEFDGFYRFLLELENLQRITRMHDVTIERQNKTGADASGAGTMKAEFTLSIYYEPRGGLVASAAESPS